MWDSITWVNGRYGTLLVTHGKTKAARRMLPMSPRVRALLESRWEAAGRPLEGCVWPAPTKSGTLEPIRLKKQHANALRLSQVRPFVLYTLRHTFLTRLGESGCDVGRWRGSPDTVLSASPRATFTLPRTRCFRPCRGWVGTILGTVRNWRGRTAQKQTPAIGLILRQYRWWAVQDSNLRPPACKAGALTN